MNPNFFIFFLFSSFFAIFPFFLIFSFFIFLHFISCSFIFFHCLSLSFIFFHFLSFPFIFFHVISFYCATTGRSTTSRKAQQGHRPPGNILQLRSLYGLPNRQDHGNRPLHHDREIDDYAMNSNWGTNPQLTAPSNHAPRELTQTCIHCRTK